MKRCFKILMLLILVIALTMGVSVAQEDNDDYGEYAESVKLYNGKIYWIDKYTQKIYVSGLDDAEMNVFAEVPYCSDEMVVKDGYIYYYSFKKNAIVKLSMDGKEEMTMEIEGSYVGKFIITDKNIYFIQESRDNGYGMKPTMYICSMSLNGVGVKRLVKGECEEVRFYRDKLYFINVDDYDSVYSYDIESGNKLKVSEKAAGRINVYEEKIYFSNGRGLSVMNLDGSECRLIQEISSGEIEANDSGVYVIDRFDIVRCDSKGKNTLYESQPGEIEGAVFDGSKLYVVNAKKFYECDVLDPESSQLVRMREKTDSAYVENGKIYYIYSKNLKCYDAASKSEKIIDTCVDEIWGINGGYIYYCTKTNEGTANKRANLGDGETVFLNDGCPNLFDSLMGDSGIYYFEPDKVRQNSRLMRLENDGSKKTEIRSNFEVYALCRMFKSEDYIFYDPGDVVLRVDKKTDRVEEIKNIDYVLAVAQDRIYVYDSLRKEIGSTDFNGENYRVEVSGIDGFPKFNGRYFYYNEYDFDKDLTKITVIDMFDYSRREVEAQPGYFAIIGFNDPKAIYLDGENDDLMKIDMSDFSVDRIASGDINSMIYDFNKETITINRSGKINWIEKVDFE